MTLLCVTCDPGVPGVRTCTVRDVHRDGCESETCTGCMPREARVGCLCQVCWLRYEQAWSTWAILADYLDVYDRLSPRETEGGRATPTGYVPLPQTMLAADEVRSWLTGAPDDARAWVSTLDGAARAVQFSFAVQRAARAHQIQEQTSRLHRMHCPACTRLLLVRIPPAAFMDDVTVKCTHCGWTQKDAAKIDEIAAIEAMPWKGRTA